MQIPGRNTAGKLALLFILLTTSAFAKDLGVFNEVKGNAFVLSNGKINQVRIGSSFQAGDEIVTEEGAQVSFSDYYDHKFHLSGSSHIKMQEKFSNLKKGYIWIQSFHKREVFNIQTANAKIYYPHGEGIISFDLESGKTQLLVVNGTFNVANLLQEHLIERVETGQFTFVNEDYNNGHPRKGTFIGEKSFNKITGLFQGVSPMFKQNIPIQNEPVTLDMGRKIASVETEKAPVKVKTNFNLNKYYSQKFGKSHAVGKKKWKKTVTKKSGVTLRIFGRGKSHSSTSVASKPARKTNNRAPASVMGMGVTPTPKSPSAPVDPFEKSLRNEYKEQTRHPSELNKLIRDLKSYDQDYSTAY